MLTNKQLENLKPKDRPYKISDDAGLYIWVAVSGSMSWQFRYQVYPNGKKTDRVYTIGRYPDISLRQARTIHQTLRLDVAKGIDVQMTKLKSRKINPNVKTKKSFRAITEKYLEFRKGRVVESTWSKDISRLERFIYPQFADMNCEDIQALDVLDYMKKISETNGKETANRTMNQMHSVLKFAMQLGIVKYNVLAGMSTYLPKPIRKHHKAILDEVLLGNFMYQINNDEQRFDLVGCAVRITPHIFVRHSEMLAMKWKDINFKTKIWKYEVSKTRDKGVDVQTVFLTDQVLEILEDARKISGDKEKVFHGGDRDNQLTQRAVLYRIRQLGFDKDTTSHHGFRATARTLGYEHLKVNRDVVEKCLAHKTVEPLGESYDRTELMPERNQFYQSWSNYLFECIKKYRKSKIRKVSG
jgi:integrase